MAAPSKKPKDRMKWLIDRGHLPAEYGELGERILTLNEGRQREPHPHMHFDSGSGGANGGGGALARVSSRQRWEKLFRLVGPDGEAVVTAVIVDGLTTDEAAEALNIHPKAVLPLLKLTLSIIGRAA